MLQALQLSKSFGETRVLDNISFSIPQGSIFGLLGPNGSGKTTTVRILNGLLRPDSGSATISGIAVESYQQDLRRLCGVMTETANLYDELSGRQNLRFFASLFGLSDSHARCEELLTQFDLIDAADRNVITYSTGMRKRLMLSRALLHRPRMLFLDEPTSGLDPESALEVNNLIRHLAYAEGTTILLCTHQLKYAEGLCSHYGFLSKGHMRAEGTWEDLLYEAGQPRYLELRGDNIRHPLLEITSDGRQRLRIESDADAAKLLSVLVQEGALIYEATQTTLSLEDLYFAIIGRGGAA